MELKELFTNRLKLARQKKGITQEELCKLTGINSTLISKYEQGVALPGLDNLQKLIIALEISADYLLLQHSVLKEVPRVNDPELYENYFILETLSKEDRKSILLILKALIAQKKFLEVANSCKTNEDPIK